MRFKEEKFNLEKLIYFAKKVQVIEDKLKFGPFRSKDFPFDYDLLKKLEKHGIIEMVGQLRENRVVNKEPRNYYAKPEMVLVNALTGEQVKNVLNTINGEKYIAKNTGKYVLENCIYNQYALVVGTGTLNYAIRKRVDLINIEIQGLLH